MTRSCWLFQRSLPAAHSEMDGGLEVDGRNDLPFSYQKIGETDKYFNGTQHDPVYDTKYAPQQPSQHKRFCGRRPDTFFLSIALALTLALAVVAASFAGSLAAKRGTRYFTSGILSCMQHFSDCSNASCLTQPANSSSAEAVSNATCSSLNTSSLYSPSAVPNPYRINDSPFVPSSNCTALGDVYTSFITQRQFKPLCTTNLVNSDLFSVFVYYFTDCIEACAAWNKFPALNTTCYGVAFDYDYSQSPLGQYGNCWLKSSSDVVAQAVTSNRVFSASLIQ